MMKKYSYLLLILFSALSARGQEIQPIAYESQFQARASLGGSLSIGKLEKGIITDNLIQYDDRMFYEQLALTYFFHRHWGAEAHLQADLSKSISGKSKKIRSHMQDLYGDTYFVNVSTGMDYGLSTLIVSGNLGIVYRYETERFYLYPKLLIGVMSFESNSASARLKEKNSNMEYIHSYLTADDRITDYFLITAALSTGYKLTNKIYLNFDVSVSRFKPNLFYKESFYNLYTKEDKEIKDVHYDKNIFKLGIGAGIIYVLH